MVARTVPRGTFWPTVADTDVTVPVTLKDRSDRFFGSIVPVVATDWDRSLVVAATNDDAPVVPAEDERVSAQALVAPPTSATTTRAPISPRFLVLDPRIRRSNSSGATAATDPTSFTLLADRWGMPVQTL
jgi:hypothetical protein